MRVRVRVGVRVRTLAHLPVEVALRVEEEGGDAARRAARGEHEGGTQPVEAAPPLAEQRAHERGRRAAPPERARCRRHAHLRRARVRLGQ